MGAHEVSLPAPPKLLEHLVKTIRPDQVAASGDTGETLRKRESLARGEADTVNEALEALRAGKRGRRWFVLEGESRPDALLETRELVICIEGKRTERACTSTTTWMGVRSQLVRHMDAALDAFGGKRVLGLLVVEGSDGASSTTPSDFWATESANQYSPEALAATLPHRTPAERAQIVDGILGVTTWQAVCESAGIAWPP